MTKKILIDASHPEETRVVMLDGNRLEDFDVESASRRQIKGNIYLAKVIRVEPSLQAAFVEYGGNRHGFLAFGEIHPDYYQIPVADRKKLLALQAEEADEEDEAARRVASATRPATPARRMTPTPARRMTPTPARRTKLMPSRPAPTRTRKLRPV
jgi:ribonuclease E